MGGRASERKESLFKMFSGLVGDDVRKKKGVFGIIISIFMKIMKYHDVGLVTCFDAASHKRDTFTVSSAVAVSGKRSITSECRDSDSASTNINMSIVRTSTSGGYSFL